MSTRVAASVSLPDTSFIAGSVLPIQRAEELLSTLPGVISARIVASGTGSVEEIHVLTTDEVSAKQTVRNVESALIAHLLRAAGRRTALAGNIGMPLLELLAPEAPPEFWVIELSSFQTREPPAPPEVVVLTNLYSERPTWLAGGLGEGVDRDGCGAAAGDERSAGAGAGDG